MQGSFTPDSAEKFLALMREAGYEASAISSVGGLQDFSEGARSRGEQQFVAKSGEARGEYIENYDYTRCVKPDGGVYGTAGQCRKGVQEDKEENDAMGQLARMLPKGSKIVGSSGRTQTVGAKGKVKAGLTDEHWVVINEKWKEVGEKLSRQMGLLKRMSDSPKFDDLRKTTQDKIEKLNRAFTKLNDTKAKIRDSLERGRTETGRMRPLVASNLTPKGVEKLPPKARISQPTDPTPSKEMVLDKKKRGAKPGGMRVTEKIKALGAEGLRKVLNDPRLNDRQRGQLNKLLKEKQGEGLKGPQAATSKGGTLPHSVAMARRTEAMFKRGEQIGAKAQDYLRDRGALQAPLGSRLSNAEGRAGRVVYANRNRLAQIRMRRVNAAMDDRSPGGAKKDTTIGDLSPAKIAAMENKAKRMARKNRQADRAALARKLAKEMGGDDRDPSKNKTALRLVQEKVAKEGQRRQEPAPKRELRGQELGNAMVLHANIAERVRANYGGSLATKKARAELQAELDKEGALNRDEISRMLKADRAERR
jgi:hypothetical protein